MARYEINGIQYPGVTSILGIKDKSAALTGWAVKCMAEYIKSKAKKVDENYIVSSELLQKARYNYREVSQTALSVGSQTHALIEKYIKTKRIARKGIPDQVKNAFLAFLKWERKNKVTWLESEQVIANIPHGYAGTLDFIAKINGEIFVGDFKTSKAIYPEAYEQIAAYFYARKLLNGLHLKIKKLDETEYVNTYEKYDLQGACIIRLDKETGEVEYKDCTDKLESKYKAFCKLIEYYYLEKKRRLKNNIFV